MNGWTPIPCSNCMYWEPPEGAGKQGICKRFPYPHTLLKKAEDWCGEGVFKNVSPLPGRNRG